MDFHTQTKDERKTTRAALIKDPQVGFTIGYRLDATDSLVNIDCNDLACLLLIDGVPTSFRSHRSRSLEEDVLENHRFREISRKDAVIQVIK